MNFEFTVIKRFEGIKKIDCSKTHVYMLNNKNELLDINESVISKDIEDFSCFKDKILKYEIN